MKSIFTTIAFSLVMALCLGTSAFAVPPVSETTSNSELSAISFNDLVNMTPQQYTELTGEKLSFTQVVALKYTQHKLKKASNGQDPIEDDKVLMILLAIIIPPVAVYLLHDIGQEFWVNIILTLLCGLPGMIHALILVSKRFK